MKLFRVISSSGELSRRKSINAIQEAMVTVNGKLILDPFIDTKPEDDIRLDNKKIKSTLDFESIIDLRLARKNELIKILGRGELKAKLKISAHKFTASAKAAIESAGGEAIML